MSPTSPEMSLADIDDMLRDEGMMPDRGAGAIETGHRAMFNIPRNAGNAAEGQDVAEGGDGGAAAGAAAEGGDGFFYEEEQRTFILGTTVCVNDVRELLHRFFSDFTVSGATEPKYYAAIEDIHKTHMCIMDVDCKVSSGNGGVCDAFGG